MLSNSLKIEQKLSANCKNCFGLCCVALPFAKTADFAFNKEAGTPCRNLQLDFRCGIHENLRAEGQRGCTVYECFGSGQKVSQITFSGKDWRTHPELANDMYQVFPIMQQLHEMLSYLHESLQLEETRAIHGKIRKTYHEIEALTFLEPTTLKELDIPIHRAQVNDLLLQISELVRAKVANKRTNNRGRDFIGANLKNANLRGCNLRGALFIAADLTGADLRATDLIGADLRDADLSDANLKGSIFLTQAQVNSAKGNVRTQLPDNLKVPNHWL